MGKQVKIWLLLLVMSFLLSGCSLLTLEELYCLPKRSEDYDNLQSLIDDAMRNLTYSAPLTGDNRQSVQKADLDGDGVEEYLLFAKDDSENPLKILIFSQVASGYVLMDTIEGYGFAFDFVQYVQMDDKDGLEIVVGRQVSDELTRAVSVYRFTSGYARQLLSTGYSGVVCQDLNLDGMSELLLLTAGVSERGNGMAVVYAYENGTLQRSRVSNLSRPINQFQQVTSGSLVDGTPAVYVTSVDSQLSMVLDIFAISEDALINLTDGIQIQSVHNYPVFPEDIDDDDMVEIPKPILINEATEKYIIEWYTVDKNGEIYTKAYTYHNHAEGWYLNLSSQWIHGLQIENEDDHTVFYWQDRQTQTKIRLLTIYTLTGSDRENESQIDGRIILFKGDSIIYVAELAEGAAEYDITEKALQENFYPIRKEWNTEESGD